jgi:L-2-hydroxyglutarate oxidase LhgO
MPTEIADTIVIGAGVIGLAIARHLAQKSREVIVLESNDSFGRETSSRNSGVIHAGIYYSPGSLKARCCIQGKALLYAYCKERQIPHQRCGKLIVAGSDDQFDQLKSLQLNAARAGLDDLEWLAASQVRVMEPDIRAAAALYSPSTGIIDAHELMLAMLADLEAHGGMLVYQSRVLRGRQKGDRVELEVDNGGQFTLQAKTVINAAGHGATGVAHKFAGLPRQYIPTTYPVRGHYFEHSGPLPFSHLVYPLPDATGLGIHVTPDTGGQYRFGPDAEYCETLEYDFDESRRPGFIQAIQNWYPALDETRLHPGFVGIRPSLQGPGEGPADFMISGPSEHGIKGLVNLFGIESPGLTACIAIAEVVEARLAASA